MLYRHTDAPTHPSHPHTTTNNTNRRQSLVGVMLYKHKDAPTQTPIHTHIQLQIIQWKAETGPDNAVQTHRRTYPPIHTHTKLQIIPMEGRDWLG